MNEQIGSLSALIAQKQSELQTVTQDLLTVQTNITQTQTAIQALDTQKASLLSTDEKTQKIIQKETATKGKKTLTLTAIKKAFQNTTTYTATEAQKYGFIDKIELPKLPDAGVIYLTDQYLATLPG